MTRAGDLPQSVIVTGPKGENLDVYIESHILPSDEVLHTDEHPNASKTSTGIYIEDIRDLQVSVRSGKHHARTIVVLKDAAKMTHQAQNALLKLLEEPRPRLHFILQTHSALQLLDTIRSRCQTIEIRSKDIVDLPADTSARIRFMSGGVSAEITKLASDTRYFEQRTKVFELAKKLIGGTPYDKLVVIKQVGDKREAALELIAACLVMYRTLLKSRYSPKLREEASVLLQVDDAIRRNGNIKLQFMRFVIQ